MAYNGIKSHSVFPPINLVKYELRLYTIKNENDKMLTNYVTNYKST